MSQCPPIDHVLHSTMLSVLPSRGESVPHIDLFNFPELSTIFLTITEKEISFQRGESDMNRAWYRERQKARAREIEDRTDK
jgi:hypothetical protein